jgi:Polyphosphate kinase 2 (PPK2)
MPTQEVLDLIGKYVAPYRITKGKGFRLKDFDPGDTRGLQMDKGEAAELLQRGTAWLAEEQDILYAQDRWSLLLVFQAMDAAGKDGTIKHVMSGVNPQGCQVSSFKQPSSEELDHDFMWRYFRYLRSARIAQGTGEALHLAPRRAGEELEVLAFRRAGTQVLGGLDARLRGSDRRNGDEARAVVRRAGRCSVGSLSARLSWRQW